MWQGVKASTGGKNEHMRRWHGVLDCRNGGEGAHGKQYAFI
jgi:hypothetical protein